MKFFGITLVTALVAAAAVAAGSAQGNGTYVEPYSQWLARYQRVDCLHENTPAIRANATADYRAVLDECCNVLPANATESPKCQSKATMHAAVPGGQGCKRGSKKRRALRQG